MNERVAVPHPIHDMTSPSLPLTSFRVSPPFPISHYHLVACSSLARRQQQLLPWGPSRGRWSLPAIMAGVGRGQRVGGGRGRGDLTEGRGSSLDWLSGKLILRGVGRVWEDDYGSQWMGKKGMKKAISIGCGCGERREIEEEGKDKGVRRKMERRGV